MQAEKNGPAFAGLYRVRGRRRGSGGRSPSPGYAQKQPLRQCRSCADGAPVRRQVGSDHAPCKRKNGPAFAGPYRAKGKWRESGGRSPSPGYAQKQPLRQCRSCVDSARPPPGRKQTRPLQAEKTAPLLRGRFASEEDGEDLEGDPPRPGMRRCSPCGNAGHAPTARPSAARSEATTPLASGKTAPLLRGRIAPKGSREDLEGDPPRPGMRRSSPCGNGLSIDGAPVRRQVGSKRAPCKRKNGPAFAGPFCVKGRRRGSGGRSPSPGRWTRPAPASRLGRRRSRPDGHPRRQSR